MRTAEENPPTKEKLMNAAQGLILTKGFVGTTVDEVCEKAGVTKGSFFHYFDSKDELGKVLLERYCANSKEAIRAGCCQSEKDPLKRVFGFVDFMIRMAKDRNTQGCLLGSMSQELADSNTEIRSICAKGFTGLADIIKKDLAEAKAKHAPKSEIKPQELADHFVAVLQGSVLLAKVRKDVQIIVSGLKQYKAYLKQVFNA